MRKTGILVLENGETFYGESFAFSKTSFGEVVFNTSMTGYQEILTDPSYKRQIITLTYPEIGNHGIIPEDNQSERIQAQGLIVKNYNSHFFNPQSKMSLSDFLKKEKVIGLKNIDTRKLTKIIREKGAMEAALSTKSLNKTKLLNQLKKEPRFNTLDLASEVSTKKFYWYQQVAKPVHRIGVIDFGVKKNILNLLARPQVSVLVCPLTSCPQDLLNYRLDGILLSNGPGDPNTINPQVIKNIKNLISRIPLFGICFGHQVLLKAFGYSIYKLKFGHHAANHPIKNFLTTKITISSQNHGYVGSNDLGLTEGKIEINLNDNTVAGFSHKKKKCFSVQYHPEGAPGPQDNYAHFDDFFKMLNKNNHAPK